jgi:enoyl ACP reductase
MGSLLAGKRILVTGVLTDASIAFHVARLAQQEGAQVVLTSFGRATRLTTRTSGRLPELAPVVELDVTNPEDLAALPARLAEVGFDGIDGVLHSIGFAPEAAFHFMETAWEDVATALHVSAYSLKALAVATAPLMPKNGSSIVGLTFDASVAWPVYDWMGVAKAAFESTARYLARDMGEADVRVNLVAAGPIRTMAAKSIPGFGEFEAVWQQRAPLGWDLDDPEPAARACVALMSEWFPKTTGEIVHVDGGFHAVGA